MVYRDLRSLFCCVGCVRFVCYENTVRFTRDLVFALHGNGGSMSPHYGNKTMANKKQKTLADTTEPVALPGGFPIVGIGASAGGLAAFEAFFSGMPVDVDPGMAFVLVQHLAPDHKSLLRELIQRTTRMKVFEVEDGMPVQINCAYIIPPNRDMAFLGGALQLLDPVAPRGQRLPIDFFFGRVP